MGELLLAVLLTLPSLGATKLTVFSTVLPLGKLAMAGKVTMPVIASYVAPGERNTDGTRGTMVSVIVTCVAALGPMFCVEIV